MTRKALRLAALLTCASLAMPAQADDLADGFNNPPQSVRPRVWWHWLNGNVTKDGIDKDLDWLARIGIGGVQNFDANLQTPQTAGRTPSATPSRSPMPRGWNSPSPPRRAGARPAAPGSSRRTR